MGDFHYSVFPVRTAKRRKIKEESLRHFWDNIKHSNIHIKGVPEREERDNGAENILEKIVAKNCPKLFCLGRTSRYRKHREFQTR